MISDLALPQITLTNFYASDNVDDLLVLKTALSLLEGDGLQKEEKRNVINNARIALAGVTGFIRR